MRICEVFVIVLIGTLTIVQYALPAPIFPIEMKRRHISQTIIGIAIATFSLGVMLGSVIPID